MLANGSGSLTRPILGLCSIGIVLAFTFYIAAQFQAAGPTFANTFDVSMQSSIISGTTIILIYTLLGGFWAVSITDTLQGLLITLAGLILPIAGLIAVAGPSNLWQQMHSAFTCSQMQLTGDNTGFVAIALVFGLLAIGLGNPKHQQCR